MWYTFCFHREMAAESHLGNTVRHTWALLLTLSPIPHPRKGWENKRNHVLNILCHSIQVYHSFPLSLPWPQRWGNDLIYLPSNPQKFLGQLENPSRGFSCHKGRRARCSTCSFLNILHTAETKKALCGKPREASLEA